MIDLEDVYFGGNSSSGAGMQNKEPPSSFLHRKHKLGLENVDKTGDDALANMTEMVLGVAKQSSLKSFR